VEIQKVLSLATRSIQVETDKRGYGITSNSRRKEFSKVEKREILRARKEGYIRTPNNGKRIGMGTLSLCRNEGRDCIKKCPNAVILGARRSQKVATHKAISEFSGENFSDLNKIGFEKGKVRLLRPKL